MYEADVLQRLKNLVSEMKGQFHASDVEKAPVPHLWGFHCMESKPPLPGV